MGKLMYYLVIKPLSLLPLGVLYLLSDALYFLLYRVMNYRSKVVLGNLRHAYPNRSEAEIKAIADQFYRHFCDLIVEAIRVFSMPEAEAIRRFEMLNPEALQAYYEQGRHVVAVAGHYANWEIASVALPGQMKHILSAIYSPLKNQFLDQKVQASRSRYGTVMASKRRVTEYFDDLPNQPPTLVTFLSDQSPSSPILHLHWTTFLRRETGVLLGAEKYATRYDFPVVYLRVRRRRRGYYEVAVIPLEEHPTQAEPYSITERHTRLLETEIDRDPAFWLWTHRRWKHQRVASDESRVGE